MPDRQVALQPEQGQVVEDLGHESHFAVTGKAGSVRYSYPCALLAPMLQGE